MKTQYLITKYLSEGNFRSWRVEKWTIDHNSIMFKTLNDKEVILSFDNITIEEM